MVLGIGRGASTGGVGVACTGHTLLPTCRASADAPSVGAGCGEVVLVLSMIAFLLSMSWLAKRTRSTAGIAVMRAKYSDEAKAWTYHIVVEAADTGRTAHIGGPNGDLEVGSDIGSTQTLHHTAPPRITKYLRPGTWNLRTRNLQQQPVI